MKGSDRKANFDLLRLIAMLMVVSMHYLNYSGALLELTGDADSKKLIGTAIEACCIVAVNVYVLISGYFLTEAGFRFRRLLLLALQVWFYSVMIPLFLFTLTGGEGFDFYRLFGYLFPIQTEHYWFATAYVLLMLFSPVINGGVSKMTKNQLTITICCLLFVFSLMKSVSPVAFAIDRFGYDFGWFLCLYLVAAYIRRYGILFFSTAKRSFSLYALCAAMIYGMELFLYGIGKKTGGLSYYFTVPFHYNFVLCLIGAVALFYGFSFIKIKEGRIRQMICRLAPFTFGVYLFHEHVDIRANWAGLLNDYMGFEPLLGTAGFLLQWVSSVAVIFAAGILIDMMRSLIFGFFGRKLKGSLVDRLITGLDEQLERARAIE